MKKTYSTPQAEMIEFDFREQIVASDGCEHRYIQDQTAGEGISQCMEYWTEV